MNAELDRVLEPFRPGFDADGFDVSVQEFVDGVVAVRIVHKPNACEECLIPDDMLGPMLTTAFRRAAPAVTGVRIEHVQVPQ
jgi:hypothetical protein